MLYFVKNPDINAKINTIHQRVLEGRLDAEIAELLNTKGIKNLQSSGRWTEEQIEQIRWDYKLDSETPVTIGEKVFRKEQKKSKPGIIWMILSIIAAAVYLVMVYSLAFSEGLAGSKLAVYLLAAILTPFLVVGLFQIFPSFRNKRPRLVLFFWVVLIMIFTNSHRTVLPVLPLIEGRQLPDITASTDPVTSNIDKLKIIAEANIKEGFVKAKHLYEEKVMGQPPVEETPEAADKTDSQAPAVEETTEEADKAGSQAPVEKAPEAVDTTESQPPVEEAPEEAEKPESQTPVEKASEEADEGDINKSEASGQY